MNSFILYGVALAGLAAAALFVLWMRKHGEECRARWQKGIAIAAIVLYAAALLTCRTKVQFMVGLTEKSPFGSPLAGAFAVLLIWATNVTALISGLYPFWKNETVARMLKWIGTPVALLNVVFLDLMRQAYAGNDTEALQYIRMILFALFAALQLYLCVSVWLESPSPRMTVRQSLSAIGWFLGAFLLSFPGYAFMALFGPAKASIEIMDINPDHRYLLYGCFLLAALIYLALHKLPQEDIHYSLVFISLVTMLTFCLGHTLEHYLESTFWPTHLPLHICNTAMFLVPLCLIFRMKRLYYFTFFINVIGAFLAMVMPNYAEGKNLFDPELMVFWINHFCAMLMPLLLMALKEFKRPRLRQFYYSMVAFGCYFVLVLIINAWFSNFGSSDFFFINSDFIADKLGQWAKDLRKITAEVEIGGLTMIFYPVYQALFFMFYVLFTVGMWFLYEQCFSIVDLYSDMIQRRQKIKLDRLALMSQLDGRSEQEPLYMNLTDKLILKDVTKRYGTSSVYAVKDANLEVHGGEIFGFLGPNGAGKSTIIKSIVGIQPITSGEITICGYDAMRQPVEAKRQLGFVPDHYELYENLTGREYINYIADLYRVDRATRTERMDRYVALFQLEGAFDNPMKTYSHGMKQKIAIMAALVHDPKIWILDEPLTGLDPDSIFQVKECMKQHAQAGNIVFFSSHIIDVVERICDRIAIIRKGQILATHTLAEIEASGKSLETVYMETIKAENAPDAVPVLGRKVEA